MFGVRRLREEHKKMGAEVERLSEAVTKLSARMNAAESFIMAILETQTREQQEIALGAVGDFIANLGAITPPAYVGTGRDQEFRNELSRAMQVFLQVAREEISN